MSSDLILKHNLNRKKFKSLSNSDNGEASDENVFEYRQSGNMIWAEYHGGSIRKGFLIGKYTAPEEIEFVYQHINVHDELLTGKCTTQIEQNKKAKLLLHENWQWTCKDFSWGTSKLIEI